MRLGTLQHRQRGAIIILAVIIVTIIAGMSTMVLFASMSETRMTTLSVEKAKAMAVADAGISRAKTYLKTCEVVSDQPDLDTWATEMGYGGWSSNSDDVGVDGQGGYGAGDGHPTYALSTSSQPGEAGVIPVACCGGRLVTSIRALDATHFEIRSTAQYGSSLVELESVVTWTPPDPPEPPFDPEDPPETFLTAIGGQFNPAGTTGGAFIADIRGGGRHAVKIDGRNHDMSGNLLAGDAQPGLQVNNVGVTLGLDTSGNQPSVVGDPGNEMSTGATYAGDMLNLIADGVRDNYDVYLQVDSSQGGGGQVSMIGGPNDFKLVYADLSQSTHGSHKVLTGREEGYGLMVIDLDEVTPTNIERIKLLRGRGAWVGIIIVRVKNNYTPGNPGNCGFVSMHANNTHIYGNLTIFCPGQSAPAGDIVSLHGGPSNQAKFSLEAVQSALQAWVDKVVDDDDDDPLAVVAENAWSRVR